MTTPKTAAQGTSALSSNPSIKVMPIRSDGWTRERQAAFLRELSASHCVTDAARSVGMSRQSAYALRARLKGEPFDLAWAAAFRCQFDELAEAAMDRALHGVEVPHLYKGELVHTSRKFDERLTVAMLAMGAALRPAGFAKHGLDVDYSQAEFGQLLARVEEGPDTWAQESQLDFEAYCETALADESQPEIQSDPDEDALKGDA